MDIHPIIEQNVKPQDCVWYLLIPGEGGATPTESVGHVLTVRPLEESPYQELFLTGGANPSGAFGDVWKFDFKTWKWNEMASTGFSDRYQHCAFFPSALQSRLYVCGANMEGNMIATQYYDINNHGWTSVSEAGVVPLPRTFHSTCHWQNKMIVFGGGQRGADAISDNIVYSFDAITHTWSQLKYPDQMMTCPKPRHGHVMTEWPDEPQCCVLHGGMSGTTFFDDLYKLTVIDGCGASWEKLKQDGNRPEATASHGGVVWSQYLFVFGGLSSKGSALNDLWRCDIVNGGWTLMEPEGLPPLPRLDFGICVLNLPTHSGVATSTSLPNMTSKAKNDAEKMEEIAKQKLEALVLQDDTKQGCIDVTDQFSLESGKPLQETSQDHVANVPDTEQNDLQLCPVLFVHGGMDTSGEIFNDSFIFSLESRPLCNPVPGAK